MKIVQNIFLLPRNILLLLIRTYQKLLSPDHSFWAKKKHPYGYCKFFPSCSEYGYKAIEKYGVILGAIKIVWRILRCNPWSKGGVDDL
jgi:uncharacterized protein